MNLYEFGNGDCPRVPLHSIAEWINGRSFKQADIVDDTATGLPIIKIAELKHGITSQTRYANRLGRDKHLVEAGDLLYSWSGNPDTSLDVFEWHGPNGWLNQHIFRVVPDEHKIRRGYLHALLMALKPNLTGIASNKQTTGLGHVTVQDLKRLMVALPDLNEQDAILAVISPVLDMISLSRRTIGTLEDMAQALLPRLMSGDLVPSESIAL